VTRIETAKAGEHPCELYSYHRPQVTRTQYHHTKPVYLQNDLYGKIVYGPDLWVCGSCHDSIHEWLSWLLGEARKPDPEPGRYAKASAQASYDWYCAEQQRINTEGLTTSR
jgi:hypothetical protein